MNYDHEQVALVYATTFAARTDAYAAWTGEHWTAVREPLSPGVVIRAFTDKVPLSGYMIATDGTTHVGALDFDDDDGLNAATRTAGAMWANGMCGYVEPSRRGAHVWTVADWPVTALVMRRALRQSLAWAGVPESPKVELRPVSDRIDPDGLGSPLRMPTMPHPVTKRRGRLQHPDGTQLSPHLADMILAFDLTPHGAIELASEQYQPPLDIRSVPAGDRAYRPRRNDADEESASQILATLWGVPSPRPGRAVRCPAHDDKHPSLSILPDDRRVVCHAPACELHNDGRGRGTYELRQLAGARAGGG